jgi:hypothetical protein
MPNDDGDPLWAREERTVSNRIETRESEAVCRDCVDAPSSKRAA